MPIGTPAYDLNRDRKRTWDDPVATDWSDDPNIRDLPIRKTSSIVVALRVAESEYNVIENPADHQTHCFKIKGRSQC